MLVRSSSSVIAIPWPGRHKHSIASHTACKHSFIPPVANPMQDLSSPALQPASFRVPSSRALPAVLEQQDTGMNATTRFPANYYGLDMMCTVPPACFRSQKPSSLPAALCCAVCAWARDGDATQQLMIEECCFVGAPDEPWRSMPNDLFWRRRKSNGWCAASLSLFVEKSGWGTRGSS